jgi:hypothetical protein
MERVAFLIESTGTRIPCLLNPSSVVVRRAAGLRPRTSSQGAITRSQLADDPLFYTGGGKTEILLNLIFDLSLTDPSDQLTDVRELTRSLFELSQGQSTASGAPELPVVRFVWGKAWNILGVVSAVSERLEYFTAEGAPQRSWMRIRMLRVAEPQLPGDDLTEPPAPLDLSPSGILAGDADFFSLPGEGPSATGSDSSTERLDQVAWDKYGNSSWWKLIATFNNIDDPLNLSPGTTLRLPKDTA